MELLSFRVSPTRDLPLAAALSSCILRHPLPFSNDLEMILAQGSWVPLHFMSKTVKLGHRFTLI